MKYSLVSAFMISALAAGGKGGGGFGAPGAGKKGDASEPQDKPSIVILEQGVVGSLDYKIIEAARADDLYKWLKDNKYHY